MEQGNSSSAMEQRKTTQPPRDEVVFFNLDDISS